MTAEEHIKNLETIGHDGWTVTTEAHESLKWAIEVLKREPSMDVVSREAVIERVKEIAEYHTGDHFNADRVINHMKLLPSVTPERPKGEWIVEKSEFNIKVKCSCCNYMVNNFWSDWNRAKYCPNCGADMRGVRE